jgi:hypothetical protein
MLSASEKRLKSSWLKAMAAHDLAEREPLLGEFRDTLHEHIDRLIDAVQRNTKKLPPSLLRIGVIPK